MITKFLSFLVIFALVPLSAIVLAYDKDNTHPALTDEIVDFYNLSYSDQQISEEFKQLLIKGAIEEDAEMRPLNHFYDPIYNKGFANYYSSKEWAKSSEKQYASLINYAAIFEVSPSSLEDTSYGDYSYERAIKDYAIGNKKRAFRALGHTFHLLEDANVPDHTRDDPHPPIHSAFASPYEKEMAKWDPLNVSVAKPLFDKKVRPILFSNIDKYFDEVALYSNNNFFSEDTIFVEKYQSPKIIRKINKVEDGLMYRFGLGIDKDGNEYFLLRYGFSTWRNVVTEQDFTVDSDLVFNDYWSRLSNHLIPHGAGLVKLFLEQAKAAEKLYAERKVEEPKLSLFQKIIGAINPFGGEEQEANTRNNQIVSEIASGILDGEIAVNIQEESKENVSIFKNLSTPKNLNTPLPTPTRTPQIKVLQSPSPTPSVLLSPTPSPGVSPTPTLTPTLTPSATPTPITAAESSPCSDPVLKSNGPLRQVVINEIAWMGTDASTADEWLELKNNTAAEINLNCWQIIAEDGTPKIKLTSKINAGSYYLLERTDDNTIKDIAADQIYTGALENPPSGEILKLYDKDGNLQDVVGHKDASGAVVPWYYGDNTTKSSMERRNSNDPGDQASGWHTNDGIIKNGIDAAGNSIKGTPKNQNSTGTISLGGGFSGGGGSGSSSSMSLPSPEASEGTGGDTESPLFKIVINEIAWMGTAAEANDEWVELYNPTSQSVSITGWTLKSFKIASASLTLDTPNIIFATKSVGPFEYFLFERTDDNTILNMPADQFYTGALDNPGEIIELRDNTGQLQDKVGHLTASSSVSSWYAGENITSTMPPTRKTMERISPTASGTDSGNWQTNNGIIRNGLDKDGNLLFGTPKNKNSEEYSNILAVSVWPMFGLNREHTGQVSVNGPATASISWQYDFNSTDPANNLPFQPVISVSGSIYLINTDGGGGGNLSVISNNGQLEWKWPQSGTFTLSRKSIPAVLADKTVYLGVVNSIYAVASKAVDKWNICTASPECNGLKAGPITIDSKGNAYFSDENQNFQAVRSGGSLKWKIKLTTAYGTNVFVFFGQTPVIDEGAGKLYLAGTTTSNLPRFFSLDLNTGSVSWNSVWSAGSSTSETSHFSFDKPANRLYAAANAALLEINPSDGQLTEYLLSSLVASASDGIPRQPKSLVSIDSINNALLVGFDYSSVASSGSDKVLADTKTKLFSLNKTTKSVNWAYEIPLNLAGNMITVDNSGNLYFAAEDIGTGIGKLYSLDKNGVLRWELDGMAPAQGVGPVIDSSGGLYQVFGFKLYKIGL